LKRFDGPFTHYVDTYFMPIETVRMINEEWPAVDDERWHHERRDYARKSALLFPHRLPPIAQSVATFFYGPNNRKWLSGLIGHELLPDPWFTDGPLMPRVGGGLHEITKGGMLGIHTDFDAHPTGLTRCANLLIYLNEDWQDEWGGALELHGDTVASIPVHAGTAVLFETNGTSWHGHPQPLKCPPYRSRRSLALYYYRKPTGPHERTTTVYR
jgi:hypothetical protein